MNDTQIQSTFFLYGRISGLVNLNNSLIENGKLVLGLGYAPLRWCQDAALLLDGIRLGSLQADSASFFRSDCRFEGKLSSPAPILGLLPISLHGAQIKQYFGPPRVSNDDPLDPGFLGLPASTLIEAALPHLPDLPPLLARIRGLLYRMSDGGISSPPPPLDVGPVSQIAQLLRDNGDIGKSVKLTVERISRQKWESSNLVDRMKWLLGWPIGWGYQTEWAFLYAGVFILCGAWVAAYYREYPSQSLPGAEWTVREPHNSLRRRLLLSLLRILMFAIRTSLVFLVAIEVPLRVPLSQHETLVLVGITLGSSIAFTICRIFGFFGKLGRAKAMRFLASARHIGNHCIFFSIDRFLPSPGFNAYWGNYPNIGQAGRNYFYIHRLVGLVLVSVTAAGFIGLLD